MKKKPLITPYVLIIKKQVIMSNTPKKKQEKQQLVKLKLNKPENLVLEDLIRPDLPFFILTRKDDGTHTPTMTTGKRVQKHIPALYYFIHVLLERQHSDNENLRFRYDERYAKMFSRDIYPLKSKNDMRKMWGILRSLKVLEVHDNNEPNHYRKSAMAYYFKLLEPYQDAKVVEHEVMVKKSIYDRFEDKWNLRKKKVADISKITTDKVSAHQFKALQDIRINYDAAHEHISLLLSRNEIEKKKYNTCRIYLNNIRNGRLYVSKSEKCNRYYTPVTNLPKIVRPFITDAEGKSLVELDYGSFNAFAVYKILNTVNPEYKTNAEKIAFETELDLYRRILSGGDFYRDFKEIFFPDAELNRDQVKNIVLQHWFNGRVVSRNKYRKIMKSRMPRISEIIDSLKDKNSSDFSNITMQMESQLVNDTVYRKFIDTYPDAVMYTVFDSFLVEPRYASELQSMMLEEGNRYFDLNCIVTCKSAD